MASKLEMYVDILNVLEHSSPLKVSQIMSETNLNSNIINRYLEFLIKQGLVEEQVTEKSTVVYANTPRGTQVIKFFIGLDKALPPKDEDGKILRVPY